MRRRLNLTFLPVLVVFLIASQIAANKTTIKAASTSYAAPVVIDNFEDGDMTSLIGGRWVVFSDEVHGGKSTLSPQVITGGANRSKKSMRLTGTVTTDFKYGGFAGISLVFDENGRNLTGYTGVQFYARGDGRTYRVDVLTAAVKDYSYHGKEFKTTSAWKLYQIPFASLAQSQYFGRKVKWTGTDVQGVDFATSGFPIPSYSFQIDDVSFY